VADTAAWAISELTSVAARSTEGPPRPAVGLSPERESALLAAWRAAASG
jgi:hypothetical protein